MGHITCLSHLDVLRELEAPLSAGRDRVQPLMEMAQYGLWGLSAGGGGQQACLPLKSLAGLCLFKTLRS